MKMKEAMQALLDGKKIRATDWIWSTDQYIYLHEKQKIIVNEVGDPYHLYNREYKIYEEPSVDQSPITAKEAYEIVLKNVDFDDDKLMGGIYAGIRERSEEGYFNLQYFFSKEEKEYLDYDDQKRAYISHRLHVLGFNLVNWIDYYSGVNIRW